MQSTYPKSRWLIIIPLLLIVTWLGARGLTVDGFWADEIKSVSRAGAVQYGGPLSFAEIWERTAPISDQVPGYYMLLSIWGRGIGLSEFGGRSLSLLLGVLTVAWTYRLGKDTQSHLVGLAAAVALSSSAFYILFLHELRSYALVGCLAAMLIWFYWRIINHHTDMLSQIGLILCAAGLLYSHYFSAVIVAAICFYHLIFIPKKREWWRVVILMGLAGLLFLPWFLTSFSVFDDVKRLTDRRDQAFTIRETFQNIATAYSNDNNALLLLIGLIGVLPAKAGLKQGVRFNWMIFLFAMAFTIGLNETMGFLSGVRYVLVLWIPLSLVVGLGVGGLARLGVPPIIVLGVLLGFGLLNSLDPSVTKTLEIPVRHMPWQRIADEVEARGMMGDVLAFLLYIEEDNEWDGANATTAGHYLYEMPIRPTILKDVRSLPDVDYLRLGQAAIAGARRVWVAYEPSMRPWRTGAYQNMLLENGYTLCGNVVDSPQLFLELYAHTPFEADEASRDFGTDTDAERISLHQLESIPDVVEGELWITHGWHMGASVPPYVYSVAVHLVDADGELVSQADYGLPVIADGCVTIAIPVDDLPSGDYTVRVGVYAWETGALLPAWDDSGATGDYLELGQFKIE